MAGTPNAQYAPKGSQAGQAGRSTTKFSFPTGTPLTVLIIVLAALVLLFVLGGVFKGVRVQAGASGSVS